MLSFRAKASIGRLAINFADKPLVSSRVRWMLLAAGIAVLGSQLHFYASVKSKLAEMRVLSPRVTAIQEIKREGSGSKETEMRFTAAERTLNRLTFDWHLLFTELERPLTADIALSSIAPDPQSRSVVVAGFAKDYLALLSYLATLRESKVLTDVFLKRHEAARNQPKEGLSFTLSASWRALGHPRGNKDLEI